MYARWENDKKCRWPLAYLGEMVGQVLKSVENVEVALTRFLDILTRIVQETESCTDTKPGMAFRKK